MYPYPNELSHVIAGVVCTETATLSIFAELIYETHKTDFTLLLESDYVRRLSKVVASEKKKIHNFTQTVVYILTYVLVILSPVQDVTFFVNCTFRDHLRHDRPLADTGATVTKCF